MSAALAYATHPSPAADACRGEFPLTLPLRHAGPRSVVLRWELRGDPTLPVDEFDSIVAERPMLWSEICERGQRRELERSHLLTGETSLL